MKNARARLALAMFALALVGSEMLFLMVAARPVQASAFLFSSGSGYTAIFSGQCFHCLINPPSAYCSCSAPGKCATAATVCGNCDLLCGGTVLACNGKCPGCNLPFNCPPAKGSTRSTSTPTVGGAKVVAIQPTYSKWIRSQSLLDGLSAASPLMTQLVLHMRDAEEQWGCSYLTGWVVDPGDSKHVQSKLIIDTDEFGTTTFSIINRSTDRDEILTVQPAGNTWQLRTTPSYLSNSPLPGLTVASGLLDEGAQSGGALTVDNHKVVPIEPAYSKWIRSRPLLEGVSAASPLMRQLVLHMQDAKDQWGMSYSTGWVVDPDDPKHLQSKAIIHSNEFGITTFTVVNRLNDRDEILTVHPAKNMWQLRSAPSYAPATPQSLLVVARGQLG